ncbi:short-chain dehydrogenase [Elysia marginata]|uniref:Short-chain dehydrogenase n=1 Tax=Elysia marginata TaxID=1093978 RepID=A0AAV4HDH7_9GAST|nr:short-chain dehydrogenase [Elysia marginata]
MKRILYFSRAGIRINAINPTIVRTRIFRENPEDFHDSELGQFFAQSHPLHGRASKPEEQAEVILFLSSPAANFITGECVRCDGAITLKGFPPNYFVPGSKPSEA